MTPLARFALPALLLALPGCISMVDSPDDAGTYDGGLGGPAALQVCVVDSPPSVPPRCSAQDSSLFTLPVMDFGLVDATHPETLAITLTDIGGSPLILASAPHLCNGGSIYTFVDQIPRDALVPGASGTIQVTASPPGEGLLSFFDALCIDLPPGVPGVTEFQVPFIALPYASPQLCWSAPAHGLDFGTLDAGVSASLSASLYNCGHAPLTFTAFSIQPVFPTTSEFSLVAGTFPDAGATWQPDAGASFTFQYVAGGQPRMDVAQVYSPYSGANCDAGIPCSGDLFLEGQAR